MANKTQQKLFAEFPPVTTEQWEAAITADLKGADYERKLVWKTAEGFNVRPYYRAEDLKEISFLGSKSGEFPFVRGIKHCNSWLVYQTVKVTDPAKDNLTLKEYKKGGVTSVGLIIDNQEFTLEELEVLLEGLGITAFEYTLGGHASSKVMDMFLAKAECEGVDKEMFTLNLNQDPILGKLALKGSFGCSKDGSKHFNAIKNRIEGLAKYDKVKVVNVNGSVFHNSGSTIVQELAYTLAAGHDYLVKLMELGLSVDEVASRMRFTMAISSNYFMEIAKIRAARMLWANIVSAYAPKKKCSPKMFIHAVTSKWNMSVYDPYVNMLRGTTEAMSATMAGVHSLEVLPFDAAFEEPTEFSARIARNVQLLLKHESHIDQVIDPAGGSYYIETLTKNIAEQAWALFKEVEDKGGYTAAFFAGDIQSSIEASAAKKDMMIATRRLTILGTNQFPNFNEVADEAVSEDTVTAKAHKCDCGCTASNEGAVKVLIPYRGAMAFEQMRLDVDRSGKEPKAFMLTCGSLAFARARAQFACNFFACAGIRVQDNTYFQTIEEGVAAAKASGAEIVVICAADDDYATLAPEAKAQLGDDVTFVVAGAPKCQGELEEKGIKNFISVKSNVLETLKSYLQTLGIK
ncbi:MAG: methylmalonyl-CoA mutase family protein [Rikenellaceae bacterium]